MKRVFTLLAAAAICSVASAATGVSSAGWFMAEDFDESGATVSAWNKWGGTGSGTVAIADDPVTSGNKVASFTGGDYNTVLEISVTLPQGKTLKDYTKLTFDLYRVSGDEDYKNMLVRADDYVIHEDTSNPHLAGTKVWTSKSYAINASNTVGNTFKLRIGIESNKANYLIDNVRLKELAPSGTSFDGQVTPDGKLVVEDFNAIDTYTPVALWDWTGKEISGDCQVKDNPTEADDEDDRVAEFIGGNYNTLLEIPVTLPAGKTLKDYSSISYDFYRIADDQWKKWWIQADDVTIYRTSDFSDQGALNTWITRTYKIPADIATGNTFKLHLGVETNAGDYMIDNIMLKERPIATGINTVSGKSASVRGGKHCISVSNSGASKVTVFSVAGGMIYSGVVNSSENIDMLPGLYVVSVDGNTYKVIVK